MLTNQEVPQDIAITHAHTVVCNNKSTFCLIIDKSPFNICKEKNKRNLPGEYFNMERYVERNNI